MAGAALGDGDGGDGGDEGLADAAATEDGANEEVFQKDARVAAPGGVVVEVESESGGSGKVVGCWLLVVG